MFNPSELTVKKAKALLDGLDLSELEEVLRAEIDGGHRSSLIAAIGKAIDAIKTEQDTAAAVVEAIEPPVVATPSERVVTPTEWYGLRRHQKDLLQICPDGNYRER